MKKLTCSVLTVFLLLNGFLESSAQVKIDISNPARWQIYNRTLQSASKDSVAFSEGDDVGLWILKEEQWNPGIIEFDVRGENNMNRSFVGIAFNLQDEKTYEGIYFRPFNFYNPDTVRRSRAVQYVYMPNYPWEKLREEHPGQYEHKVLNAPNPDKWFHAKIVFNYPEIKVFVDGNTMPSLVVNSLAARTSGKIGLWLGNGSRGSFANLVVTPGPLLKATK
jgi:hypothetical protein